MGKLPDIKGIWNRVRHSTRFHNSLVFLIFVVIAAIFWFVMAMNDIMQRDFMVKVDVVNVPDSVTFITDPPETFHVAVRDQGTSLLRVGGFRTPTMHLNFRDYATDGVFRVSEADMLAALKGTFGKSASILAISQDSIRVSYTTTPGRMVPVRVVSNLETAPGSVLSGEPKSNPSRVTIYGPANLLDTILYVSTEPVTARSLHDSKTVWAELASIRGVRVKPSKVEVKIGVETLVRKEMTVKIKTINTPPGVTLMLFPSQIKVSYYVPMSKFGEDNGEISVIADYNNVSEAKDGKFPVYIGGVPSGIVSPELSEEAVEYSVVR